MSDEIWADVPSVEGLMASSLGRVKAKPFEGEMPHGGKRIYPGKAWYGAWDAKTKRFSLYFRGKNYRVSRIVCEAFHGPKPFPAAVVMHMDEDSSNNRPENLAWGTQKENLNFPGFLKKRSALSTEMNALRREKGRCAA